MGKLPRTSSKKTKRIRYKMKLHLGCGNKKLEGFVNIDIISTVAVDVIDDVCNLKKLPNGSVDLIYACHILEHFPRKALVGSWDKVLERWTEILKPGGIIRLSVPNFEKVAEMYSNKTYGIEQLLGFLYGGQTNIYNFHYMAFDYSLLEKELLKLGYRDIRLWDWRETEHSNVDDYSQAYLPHMDKENGVLMSLNIEATKL